jgi:aminoglycoside phosphotransferase (APT) family kinase protein
MRHEGSTTSIQRRLDLLGRGYTADVYVWDAGRVLKLFHRGATSDRAEREFRATKSVHAAGLPSPAVYDLIELDGRLGIVFERLHGRSMLEEVQRKPWTLVAAARQLARLHVVMHERLGPAELPPVKARFREWIVAADRSQADKVAALAELDALSDGDAVCHGDFHPANVLRTTRGWVAVDWGAAFRGPPSADVACTSRLFDVAELPDWSPRYMHWLMALSRRLLHRTYLSHYRSLGPASIVELDDWKSLFNAWRPPATDSAMH